MLQAQMAAMEVERQAERERLVALEAKREVERERLAALEAERERWVAMERKAEHDQQHWAQMAAYVRSLAEPRVQRSHHSCSLSSRLHLHLSMTLLR
jgi:hypothetical protein